MPEGRRQKTTVLKTASIRASRKNKLRFTLALNVTLKALTKANESLGVPLANFNLLLGSNMFIRMRTDLFLYCKYRNHAKRPTKCCNQLNIRV